MNEDVTKMYHHVMTSGKAIFIDKKIPDNLFGVLVLVMFADQRGSVSDHLIVETSPAQSALNRCV